MYYEGFNYDYRDFPKMFINCHRDVRTIFSISNISYNKVYRKSKNSAHIIHIVFLYDQRYKNLVSLAGFILRVDLLARALRLGCMPF